MAVEARPHVPRIATVLSVVSLGLVFGAVGGVIPTAALPRMPAGVVRAIPTVNVGISLLAIAVIGYGWVAIRRGRIRHHRVAMIAGFGLFATFLALYLYRVSLVGPTEFQGPSTVGQFVYWPVLAIHVSLAVVCVPLLWYVLLLGLVYPVGEIPLTRHPRLGRLTAALWLTSFALGIVVYLLLYVLF